MSPNGRHQNSVQATQGNIFGLQNTLSWMKNDLKIQFKTKSQNILRNKEIDAHSLKPIWIGHLSG